jgi:hypothetical protein
MYYRDYNMVSPSTEMQKAHWARSALNLERQPRRIWRTTKSFSLRFCHAQNVTKNQV